MKKITRDEFMQALRDYHPALHCELYTNYRHWYFGEEVLDAEFFSADGCVIVCSAYEYEGKYPAYCYIHEVSDDCDFASMTKLDGILKSRDITLQTKVHLVKTMVFSSSHVWM